MLFLGDARKRSLRTHLLFWVWLVSSLATFIIISIQLLVDYNKEKNIAVEQISVIKKNFLPSINKSLWDYNYNYLDLQLESVRNLPYVNLVRIHSDDFKSQEKSKVEPANLRMETMPLVYKGEHIGELEIGLDIIGIQKSFVKKLIYIFFFQGLKTLIVCYLLLKIFDIVIMRHISEIALYLKKFDLQDGKNLKLKRSSDINDELSMLVFSINSLKSELSQTSKDLHELNADLENKVTERSKLLDEERTRSLQSAKLASLGEMAGGIAHEINNPLAIISSTMQLLKRSIDRKSLTEERLIECITMVEATVVRASKIIKGLKNVSHTSDNFDKRNVKARDIIEDVLGLCSERFKNHGVILHINLTDAALEREISCDRVQFSQVLINLLGNSFDAIGEARDKWVKLELQEDEQFDLLKITDSGEGIPNEIADKIFNPFFTSKEVGKGTGLGLSISRSIMAKHDGMIEIDKSSSNTCFILKLPKVVVVRAEV